VCFAITDSGTGISPEVSAKMMQPFFTTKPIGKGTGLGLSVSNGIIESHQGNLYFDAESSHTRFVAIVPQSQRYGTQRADHETPSTSRAPESEPRI
jgi:C4-dicarboxylate-specific signal transduction histidine kinase